MNRSLAALRGFYKFLLQEKVVEESPLANIELAKVWMRLPDTVSPEEMNLILSQPGDQTPVSTSRQRDAGASLRDGAARFGINFSDDEQYQLAGRFSDRHGEGKQGTGRAHRQDGL